MNTDSSLPFPEFPSSKSALIVPIVYVAFVLLFTYIEFASNFNTNPVIFFGVLMLIVVVTIIASGIGIDTLIDALGVDVGGKTWKIGVSISAGLILGSLLYNLTTPLSIIGIQPLTQGVTWAQFLNTGTSTTGTKVGLTLAWFLVVGVGEEIEVLAMTAIIANILFKNNRFSKTDAILTGAIVARILWSMEHLIAYTFIQSAPITSYVIAVVFGLAFSGLIFMFYLKTGNRTFDNYWNFNEPVMIGGIIAHIIFDVLIGLKYLGINGLGITYAISLMTLMVSIILLVNQESSKS